MKEVTSAVVSVIVSVLRISSLVEGREETMGDADTEDGEGEGGGRDGDSTRGMGMGEEKSKRSLIVLGSFYINFFC